VQFLHLDDAVEIASAVLNLSVQDVRLASSLTELEGALLQQAQSSETDTSCGCVLSRAAALGTAIAQRDSFVRGNAAIAWACVREFVWRNGIELGSLPVDATVTMMRSLRTRRCSADEFARWLVGQAAKQQRGAA
jgi:prophage maintenance system killer protein